MEPVPSSADGGPIEYSGVRAIANFNPMSAATRTGSKNILADQFVEIYLLEAKKWLKHQTFVQYFATRRKIHSPELIHYNAKASTTSLYWSKVSKF